MESVDNKIWYISSKELNLYLLRYDNDFNKGPTIWITKLKSNKHTVFSLYSNICFSEIKLLNLFEGKSHKENKSFNENFCLKEDILCSPVFVSYFRTQNFFNKLYI